ncbi:ParB/RepB/Spo0J family partition protein [Microbacterium sp. CH-015]|uniref:ParB/RepB/Spo0J family partition protein n=1 Tax=Microbacterium sp. CH-015 TaxID=3406734 RepID=UPI003C729440
MNTTDPETHALQLITLDPTTIRTLDQIRQSATPDEGLIQSVAENGILQPPSVVWNDDEQAYYLVFGARRVGAAIIVGLTEIPVIVRDPATLTEAILLGQQIVENERREAIPATDLARAWSRLEELFGESIEDIAARTGENSNRVTAGIRAARSEKTTALLASRPALDLEKAAILTEFDEHPTVQRELAETAVEKPQDFDWKVRAAQDRIAKDARIAELKAEARTAKVKLAKSDGYGSLKAGTTRISNLVDAAGKKLTARNHAACPGHRAFIDGYRAEDLKIEYACEGYEDHGHTFPSRAPREQTDEEKQAETARREHAAALEANRAARRQWITNMLPGKINQLPGVYEYMHAALAAYESNYADHRAPDITIALLNTGIDVDTEKYGAATDALNSLIETRKIAPFRMMLAISLAVHERKLAAGRASDAIVRHYEHLERWGYALTELDAEALTAHRDALTPAQTDDVVDDSE